MFSVDELTKLELDLSEDTLLLVPNFRSSRQLQDQLSALQRNRDGKPVQAATTILAIDLWLSDFWLQLALYSSDERLQAHILSSSEEALLWQQIIANSPIGSTLLNINGTADTAREAWQLFLQWQLPTSFLKKLSYGKHSAPDLATHEYFADWAFHFQHLCHEKQVMSFSSMLTVLLELSQDQATLFKDLLPKNITLWGFSDPPPLYQKLFAALGTLGIQVRDLKVQGCKPTEQVQALPKAIDEIAAAADWAALILEKDPSANIGIICADLSPIQGAVQRIFSRKFSSKTNSTFLCVGQNKLVESGLMQTALGILQVNEEFCETLSLCQLLHSPWLQGIESESDARAQLELKLRDKGEIKTKLNDFRTWCLNEDSPCYAPILGTALLDFHTQLLNIPQHAPLRYWFALFHRVWDQLLNTEALDFDDSKALRKGWQEFQKAQQQCDFLFEQCTLNKAKSILSTLAQKMQMPALLQTAPIMIMSPTASAGLRFTHLWCMQMNDKYWPEDNFPNPFLPLPLQKSLHLPKSDPQMALDEALTKVQQFKSSTLHELVFSYAQAEDDLELKPTCLLPDIETISPISREIPAGLNAILKSITTGQALNDIESLTLPLLAQTEPTGGSSLLANQAACPFRAFAITRLDARELKAVRYGLPASALGSCVHHALELFWELFSSSDALLSAAKEDVSNKIATCVDTALRQTAKHYPYTMTPRFIALEQTRLSALLQQWLAEEAKRGSFTRLNAEQGFKWRYSTLTLNLRIDRIDSDSHGNSVIIDYKTGRKQSIDWEADRQDAPQLMLYLQAVEQSKKFKPVSALLYAQINIEKAQYTGIGINNDVHPGIAFDENKSVNSPDWTALKLQWQESLQALAKEFLDGYVAVDPLKTSTCTYCHLGSLCRIGERRSTYLEDASENEELAGESYD